MEKKFTIRTTSGQADLLVDLEHAVSSRDVQQLLQAFVEGADLSAVLPHNVREVPFGFFVI